MEENSLAQKLGAEALGTAVLVFLGAGSVPALFLARGGAGGAPFTGAELFAISTAFGLAVVAMVYAIGKISGLSHQPGGDDRDGGHQADGVDAGSALRGRAVRRRHARRPRDLGRLRAQGERRPASATSPTQPTPPSGSAMLNEGIGTAILLFTILGIVDKRGGADLLAGLVIGLIVIGIIITVGAADGRSDQPRPLHGHADHRPAGRPQPGLGTGLGVLGRATWSAGWPACSPTTCWPRRAQVAYRHASAESLEPTAVESPA